MKAQVAVIYRKVDGKIVRVSTLSRTLIGKVTEEDIDKLLPGMDTIDFAMVFVGGKEYLDIDRYRVETDMDGNFMDIVEKVDVLASFSEEPVVEDMLMDREIEVVIGVLSVIDDKARLAKYKELEIKGRQRPEVLNFFKEKGV